MVTLDDIANALNLNPQQDVKGFAAYGEVKSINADGTYQVSLNGSTTTVKCARLTGAHIGDVVLVTVLNNGYAVATGCVGGDTDALEAKAAADGTAQFFWYKNGTGDEAGAHITEVPRSEFEADPQGGNLLMKSNGMKIRDATTDIGKILASGLEFKGADPNGNWITYFLANAQDSLIRCRSIVLNAIGLLKYFITPQHDKEGFHIFIDRSNTVANGLEGVSITKDEIRLSGTSDDNQTHFKGNEVKISGSGEAITSGYYDNAGNYEEALRVDALNKEIFIADHAEAVGYTREAVATNNLADTTAITKLSDLATLEAGTWIVNASIRFPSSTSGTRAAQLHKNSTPISASYVASPANGVVALNLTAVISSDSPIDLDIYARQNSGAAMSIATYWQAVRII